MWGWVLVVLCSICRIYFWNCFDVKMIIINGFIMSLQHLVLWGFKCSSQNFRKKMRNIHLKHRSLYFTKFTLPLQYCLILFQSTTQTLLAAKEKSIQSNICRYIVIWKIQYFRVACLILCCGPLFAIAYWNHSENIITLVHKPNRKGRYYTFSGVWHYHEFPYK